MLSDFPWFSACFVMVISLHHLLCFKVLNYKIYIAANNRIKCARYLLCSDYTFVQLIRWVILCTLLFRFDLKSGQSGATFAVCICISITCAFCEKNPKSTSVHLVGCNCRSPLAGQIHPCTNCSKWNSLPAAFVSLSFAYFRMDFSDTLGTGIKIPKIIKKNILIIAK